MDALAIKQANSLSEIIGKDMPLTKRGNEYWAPCPFHKEKTSSFSIYKNNTKFKCFGCGATGSVIDYVMLTRSMTFQEACKILKEGKNLQDFSFKPLEIQQHDIYEDYPVILPAPPHAPLLATKTDTPAIYRPRKLSFKTYSAKIVNDVCAFKDLEGNLIGYEFRIVIPETKEEKAAREKLGKKQEKTPMPVTWCKRPDGSEGWTLRKFDNPKPLYGQERLKEGGQILIVEGAPKAKACQGNVGSLIPIAMMGGVGGYKYAHLELLKGRKIVIWPDKDERGGEFALNVANALHEIGVESIKILTPPAEMPNSWDAKDAFEPKNGEVPWDYTKFLAWAKESATTYAKPEIIIEPVTAEEPAPKGKRQKKTRLPQVLTESDEPFKILGFDGNNYYYIGIRGQRIIPLTASAHTRNNLFKLAPESYWDAKFPGERGIKWDTAVSCLIDASEREGIFTPFSVRRGRGAWLDDNRKIFHMGDKILMEGKEYKPFDIKSEFVYEAEKRVVLPSLEPLSNEEAKKLIGICEGFNWENELSGKLLAGWCVIAGICGMLEWRPHIWITGGSNTGKTTATKVVRRMLKPFSRSFGGGGTEAGIRRSIQKDAIPVIIDEAEGENKRQREKVKAILFLARQASSGDIIAMAGKDGQVEEFIARSCFCFSSINPSIDSEPDQTRVTQLTLVPDYSGSPDYIIEKYEKLKDITEATITPEFASGMLMRAFYNIENLLHNIKTFQKAGASVFKRPRIGEQLAPLIAGAYLCHSTGRISMENAIKWIAGHNWENHLPEESSKDIWKLLRLVLSYRFRFSDGNKTVEKTLGQLIIAISAYNTNSDLYLEEINQLGIDVIREEDAFYIANVSPMLEKILNNTPWEKEWGKRLKELPGAKSAKDGKPHYYCSAIKERGTSIPLKLIRKEVEPVEEIALEKLGEEVKFEDA